MTLKEDLTQRVSDYARMSWGDIPDGNVVPTSEKLTFGNTGIRILGSVFYADIDGSTGMVDLLPDTFAAEYYKAYLHCAAKIIKINDGTITAYDGDRVMAVYVGAEHATNAVTAALQLNWAVKFIINPAFAQQYPSTHHELRKRTAAPY